MTNKSHLMEQQSAVKESMPISSCLAILSSVSLRRYCTAVPSILVSHPGRLSYQSLSAGASRGVEARKGVPGSARDITGEGQYSQKATCQI